MGAACGGSHKAPWAHLRRGQTQGRLGRVGSPIARGRCGPWPMSFVLMPGICCFLRVPFMFDWVRSPTRPTAWLDVPPVWLDVASSVAAVQYTFA